MKILFMTNAPAGYRVDFFNCLGELCELTVLFESEHDKSRNRSWESNDFKNFNAVFLKGIKYGDADAFCPEVVKFLNKKYDLIVIGAYHTPTGMLAGQYLRLKKKSFIISSDGGMVKNDSKLVFAIKKKLISSAAYWISTGVETNKYLMHYGAERDKIYIYPFTSISESMLLKSVPTREEKSILKKKLGIEYDKYIIAVGQFIHRKGFDILLRSVKYIHGNVGVYIIGGKETVEYRQLIENDQLTNVHFLNFLEKQELGNYYKAADLFVLPTREDIWGLVVNEAMAYALPVITTTKCVAGLEMVDNGSDGFLIESEDYLSLAEKCNYILSSDNQSMCQNALLKANKYTLENMARIHYEIFNKIKKLEE
ncbi:glycosyltransferase family 4 protein [Mediterraneibacter glycyrrhizinilyticus]|uniref:glycosyltransferase family 4 protein n=1 Tax=Mediterraneibacter glycyrrhizinilyticus TaxID=342942 RepID=UPI0025A4AD6C|nr:glycosyltransferase family 4 protein [Mediterraneibacter glycyrrhizinilyticus]MDM8209868.1 glycosyltransferase family 4 protein [Mediterraneibacter glycyrrhizinilyticus]